MRASSLSDIDFRNSSWRSMQLTVGLVAGMGGCDEEAVKLLRSDLSCRTSVVSFPMSFWQRFDRIFISDSIHFILFCCEMMSMLVMLSSSMGCFFRLEAALETSNA